MILLRPTQIYELGSFYFVKPEEISKGKNNNKGWAKDKAEEYFLKALTIKEKSLGPNHPDVARILNRLGSVCIFFPLVSSFFSPLFSISCFISNENSA